MKRSFFSTLIVSVLLSSLLLAGCGGGSSGAMAGASTAITAATEPGAPQVTGNTAIDGFNWFNYRRQQLGLPALVRNPQIDAAAQNHSSYQAINNALTHEESSDKPGYTGAVLWNESKTGRLAVAGYQFTAGSYAYGEVISGTNGTSGAGAASDLITAIYHRFVIFEPMFKEAGAGAATAAGGYTYFTTDFAANGLDAGLGKGNFVVYPYANQLNVPIRFFSNSEIPDPVPDKNEVGFPISVHADILSSITVQSFTVKPRGGAAMPVRMLTHAVDAQTPESAAAIVPLDVLVRGATYDVEFLGAVDGVPANRTWSFTTQP